MGPTHRIAAAGLALVGALAPSPVASARDASAPDRLSVRMAHYEVHDPEVIAGWYRRAQQTHQAMKRRMAELQQASEAGRLREAQEAGPLPYEIEQDGFDRQLALVLPFEPVLVQECVVEPGRRVAQRSPAPGFPPGHDHVLHVRVESVEAQRVLVDLAVEYDSPANRAPPEAMWGWPAHRPLGRPSLYAASGPATLDPRPGDTLSVQVVTIRPSPDGHPGCRARPAAPGR